MNALKLWILLNALARRSQQNAQARISWERSLKVFMWIRMAEYQKTYIARYSTGCFVENQQTWLRPRLNRSSRSHTVPQAASRHAGFSPREAAEKVRSVSSRMMALRTLRLRHTRRWARHLARLCSPPPEAYLREDARLRWHSTNNHLLA